MPIRFASAFVVLLLAMGCSAHTPASPAVDNGPLGDSQGVYRLPYADGVQVKVFDDFTSHRPAGRIDFFAVGGPSPYRVVAAASGRVMSIQDSYSEQQSGRAAADCRNNFVWVAHPNGEWSSYSHMRGGSVRGDAGLSVGDAVTVGQFIGYEAAVGCAMLNHVHFEVGVPATEQAVDAGGFLIDNEDGKRLRNPRFCGIDGKVAKDATYTAAACR